MDIVSEKEQKNPRISWANEEAGKHRLLGYFVQCFHNNQQLTLLPVMGYARIF